MKKTKLIFTSIMITILLSACASTPEAAENNDKSPAIKTTQKQVVQVQKTPEELFLESLEGISIKSVSAPKEITKGRNFNAPFVFSAAEADGTPAEGLKLTISYPSDNTEGNITYSKIEMEADADGKITFTPEQPSFAANTLVSVYPTPVSEDTELAEKLSQYTATAAWKVKSDIASKGAVLFIWDFNEKDRPQNNSNNIQAEFRSRGITMVGNGPVNETSYIGKIKQLYKETYDIIGGTQFGYLLYGTVKFEQPVTALEDGSGYYCILKAEIEALNMKSGAKVYSSVIKYESKGKNWNECVSKGKDKLSELVVDDIMYGL